MRGGCYKGKLGKQADPMDQGIEMEQILTKTIIVYPFHLALKDYLFFLCLPINVPGEEWLFLQILMAILKLEPYVIMLQ